MTEKADLQPKPDSTGKSKGFDNLLPTMWKPGQSGNPGGKSKRLEEIRALARDKSMRAMQRLVELVESEDERVAFMAAKERLDRAYGKVKEVTYEDNGDGHPGPPQAIEIYIVRPNA